MPSLLCVVISAGYTLGETWFRRLRWLWPSMQIANSSQSALLVRINTGNIDARVYALSSIQGSPCFLYSGINFSGACAAKNIQARLFSGSMMHTSPHHRSTPVSLKPRVERRKLPRKPGIASAHNPKKNQLLNALPPADMKRWLPHLELFAIPLARQSGILVNVHLVVPRSRCCLETSVSPIRPDEQPIETLHVERHLARCLEQKCSEMRASA